MAEPGATQQDTTDELPGIAVQSPLSERTYRMYSPLDARRARPAIVPLVEGLILPNSLGVWVGAYGVGKTWALLDLAVCMATGAPWLSYPVKQGGVLLIDEESGERRLSDRVQMVLDAHDAPDDAPLHYTCFNSFNFFNDEKSGSDLVWLIKQYHAQMVVIDAMTDVSMPAKENDAQEMGIVLKTLKLATDITGASIQLLHHENKMGGARGSTNIPALVDVAISVKDEKKTGVLSFAFIKARDVAQFEFGAAMNFDPGKMWLSPHGTGNSTEIHLSRSQRYVLDFLGAHPDASMEDIMSHADMCSANAARQAVYSLVGMKRVRRSDGGANTQKATYALTSLSKDKSVNFDMSDVN